MRVAVVGAGGVGGYLATRLAAAGVEVGVIARGAHLEAIRAHGLRLESPLGDAAARPAHATDRPADVGPVDCVISAVKLYDVAPAAEAMRPLIGPATGVLTLQNGVDGPALTAGVLGPEHVLGGVAKIAAHIAAPGLVRHTGIPPRFIFGELDGKPSERTAALARALDRAGVEHAVSGTIVVDIWRKMVLLAPLAGLTSLVRLPIGPIRSTPETRRLLANAVEEAVAVGRAHGVRLPDSAAADATAFLDRLPESNRSSMLDDLESGRRIELPWLSGALVRLGTEHGVPTPTHDLITAALAPFVSGRR
jgi:2-dehydropantoate 2-reductase